MRTPTVRYLERPTRTVVRLPRAVGGSRLCFDLINEPRLGPTTSATSSPEALLSRVRKDRRDAKIIEKNYGSRQVLLPGLGRMSLLKNVLLIAS